MHRLVSLDGKVFHRVFEDAVPILKIPAALNVGGSEKLQKFRISKKILQIESMNL